MKEDMMVKVSKQKANDYLSKNIVHDFSDIPVYVKLAMLQKTPKKFIRYRKIASKKIPYIDHFYAERALNFISNFNWGSQKISSNIKTTEKQTKNGTQKCYEAYVEMNMWAVINGEKIERFIASGHTMYENPAINKADAMQSAISKANTKFARQFGVGDELTEQENKVYGDIETAYIDAELIGEGQEPKRKVTDKKLTEILKMSDEYIEEHKDLLELTEKQQKLLNKRLNENA
jgi:hypothetical protein